MVTLDDEIDEVEREIAQRKKLYPYWISTGKLKEAEATLRMNRLKAVLERLRAIKQPRLEA